MLPDAQRAIALELRGAAELAQLADRIYTRTPANVGADAFVLVRRFGGAPTLSRPLVHETASLQIDSYGGRMRDAERNARAVAAVLAELVGPVSDGELAGVVTGTTVGALRELFDETFEPARPRYVLDVDVFLGIAPAAVPAGAAAPPAAVPAGVGVRQSTS